jgi:catechol 2,3-dioxygenase-like lactoylglutathione lyase family enzyme
MSVRRVTPNIKAERLDESHQFYVEVLGLDLKMDLDSSRTLPRLRIPTSRWKSRTSTPFMRRLSSVA